jgi:hypothetical protein
MRNSASLVAIFLILSGVSDCLAEDDCGPPPVFTMTQTEDESVRGQLQGQADFLSKLVGRAELAGEVEAARKSIYQTSDRAFAAQKTHIWPICSARL